MSGNLRYVLISILFVSLTASTVSGQSVLDAHMIDEQWLYNDAPWAAYFLSEIVKYAPDSLPQAEDFVPRFNLDSYLFWDNRTWSVRVWREIPLEGDFGKLATEGGYVGFGDVDSRLGLISIIKESLLTLGSITGYSADGYHFPLSKYDLTTNYPDIAEATTSIKLKEDYSYDKETGSIQRHIIGLGLVLRADEDSIGTEKEVWLYYPELYYELRDAWFNSPGYYDYTWDRIFQERNYNSEILKVSNPDGKREHGNKDSASRLDSATELAAYFWVDEMKYQRLRMNISATDEVPIKNYLVGEETGRKYLHGNWKLYGLDSQLLVEAEFESGVPHGSFRSYWENGGYREVGAFSFGLKEGEWKSYYNSGAVMAIHNFKEGWLVGEHTVFYENGQTMTSSIYENGQLNGEFVKWTSKGDVLEEGEMKNGIKSGVWHFDLPISESTLKLLAWYRDWIEKQGIPYLTLIDGRLSFDDFYKSADEAGLPSHFSPTSEESIEYK